MLVAGILQGVSRRVVGIFATFGTLPVGLARAAEFVISRPHRHAARIFTIRGRATYHQRPGYD